MENSFSLRANVVGERTPGGRLCAKRCNKINNLTARSYHDKNASAPGIEPGSGPSMFDKAPS